MTTPLLADLVLTRRMEVPTLAYDPDSRIYADMVMWKARDAITSAPIFIIDNVADYVWNQPEGRDEIDTGFIPPFPAFWMEYRRPAFIHVKDRDRTRTDNYDDDRYGCLIYCSDVEDWKHAPTDEDLARNLANDNMHQFYDKHFILDPNSPHPDGGTLASRCHPDAKWIFQMVLILQERGGRVVGPVLYRILFVNEYGEPVGETRYLGLPGFARTETAHKISEYIRQKYAFAFSAFESALFFMNTRGIEHKENRPRAKANEQWQKKKGKPLVTYKTLVVETVVGDPARRGGGGSRTVKSEHIVRGHVADYRKGAGLFGKYKVLIYRAAHTAGSREAGAVVKDYDIRPPRKKAAGE